jgi:hypothetical protein
MYIEPVVDKVKALEWRLMYVEKYINTVESMPDPE